MSEIDFRNSCCFPFLESLPAESVDLVLTDPPYLISRETGFASGTNPDYSRLKVSMEFGEWDEEFVGMGAVLRQFHRVLKKGGTAIIFYDLWKITEMADWFTQAKFKQLRFIEWLKTNPVPLNQRVNYLTNAREIAITGVKHGKPTFHGAYDNGIYSYPIEHGPVRTHPTQKSQRLMEEIIEKHSDPGEVVLDCFAGSATTGAAAVKLQRRFLGCEVDAGYYAQACQRLGVPAVLPVSGGLG